MTKKLIILFITVVLTFVTIFAYAESPEEEQEEVEEFMEELGERSQSFTIPINVGPIYSAIIRHDGVGIVFSMIRSKSLSLGLEAVSFLTDLKEMDIFLENGQKYTVPAVVQFVNQEVGSFIILSVSGKAAASLASIISSGSPVIKFSFIQNNKNRIDMSVDEVNNAITKATGEATDVINQAGKALSVFWSNFSSGVGKYAADAYEDVSKALVDAGDYISNTAIDIGDAIADTANVVGGFIGEKMDSAGESIGDAMESVGDSIEGAFEGIGNLWNGIWGN